jgi:ABC-type phosphate/phosphonate transport system substrate-binding protein
MVMFPPSRQVVRGSLVIASALWLALVLSSAAFNQERARLEVLRIGAHDYLGSKDKGNKEAGALDTLQNFIKTETKLDNDITHENDWRQLAEKMAKGQLHLGVFEGYEFAWAQDKDDRLKPLALAVNVYRYPVVYVVTRRDHAATDFAGLRGQSLSEPTIGAAYVRLYLDRQCQAGGTKMKDFFSRITTPDNVEDALDDVVDGIVQAAVVDRAGLEAFKRRKPGRYGRLKAVARSGPLPPAVVAYYAGTLDQGTLEQFRNGLLRAHQKERGQTLLTLFRVTSFDGVPQDFDGVLKETRKAFPPPAPAASK